MVVVPDVLSVPVPGITIVPGIPYPLVGDLSVVLPVTFSVAPLFIVIDAAALIIMSKVEKLPLLIVGCVTPEGIITSSPLVGTVPPLQLAVALQVDVAPSHV